MWTIIVLAMLPIVALVVVTLWFVNQLNKADERLNESLAQRHEARRSQLLVDISSNQIVLYEVRRQINHSE